MFWVSITSFAVWYAIKATLGIRVDEEHEYEGVDISECGLKAYPEFTTAEYFSWERQNVITYPQNSNWRSL